MSAFSPLPNSFYCLAVQIPHFRLAYERTETRVASGRGTWATAAFHLGDLKIKLKQLQGFDSPRPHAQSSFILSRNSTVQLLSKHERFFLVSPFNSSNRSSIIIYTHNSIQYKKAADDHESTPPAISQEFTQHQ
jgi:hypothetical protein